MTDNTTDASIRSTRAKLGGTLDAIEDKLNVKKQASVLVDRTRTSWEANPVPWIIGATAAAIVVAGLVAWAIFSSDD